MLSESFTLRFAEMRRWMGLSTVLLQLAFQLSDKHLRNSCTIPGSLTIILIPTGTSTERLGDNKLWLPSDCDRFEASSFTAIQMSSMDMWYLLFLHSSEFEFIAYQNDHIRTTITWYEQSKSDICERRSLFSFIASTWVVSKTRWDLSKPPTDLKLTRYELWLSARLMNKAFMFRVMSASKWSERRTIWTKGINTFHEGMSVVYADPMTSIEPLDAFCRSKGVFGVEWWHCCSLIVHVACKFLRRDGFKRCTHNAKKRTSASWHQGTACQEIRAQLSLLLLYWTLISGNRPRWIWCYHEACAVGNLASWSRAIWFGTKVLVLSLSHSPQIKQKKQKKTKKHKDALSNNGR